MGDFLTRPNRGPYHFPLKLRSLADLSESTISRLVLILPAALVTACAGNAASQAELQELRAELRAVRQANERLEQRVERVEDAQAISRAPRATGPKKPSPSQSNNGAEQPWTGGDVPDLTVVKLKPKHEPPPPISTRTEVQEPEAEQLQDLLLAANEGTEGDGEKPDPALGDAAFDQALGALRTGNVSGAVLKLQTFAEQNPRHARADNALYYSGVGLMALDDPQGAAAAFERVLKEYPAGDARMEAMLKLADCRLKLNQKDDARTLYGSLISTYPGTAAASTAQQRLSTLTQ